MFIVHVHVNVKPDSIRTFIEETRLNAQNSIEEPGITRFDVIQKQGDPTRFVLVEVYRTPEDPAKHKETNHYARWRDQVAEMMAEPRTSVKFNNVYPGDEGWE